MSDELSNKKCKTPLSSYKELDSSKNWIIPQSDWTIQSPSKLLET